MAGSLIRLALTPGAEDGIGPEVLVKALESISPQESLAIYWCGDRASLELGCARAGVSARIEHHRGHLPHGLVLKFFPDVQAKELAQRQASFLDLSVALAHRGTVDAIVTAPIEKAALAHVRHGPFPGQTEYFAHHLGTEDLPFMAFLGGPFMLSLLTTHLPLRKVADAITEDLLLNHIKSVAKHFGLSHKKDPYDVAITVLGLNPHAGEAGLLGDEEQEIFMPAIKRAQQLGYKVSGPVAADGFFAYGAQSAQPPHVVISPFHDQGLGAYKLLAEQSAVNVTFGLTHLRVSPAHGTAHDIVGKGLASSLSTLMAIRTATRLAT